MKIIDADKLIRDVEKGLEGKHHDNSLIEKAHRMEHIHFLATISMQPTAYDVDKVVEQLQAEVRCVMDTYCGSLPDDAFGDLETLEQEIIEKVVKAGGVE